MATLNWDEFKKSFQSLVSVLANRKPCSNSTYENQCAIRLSYALEQAKFPLKGYPSDNLTQCKDKHPPLARGAGTLNQFVNKNLTRYTIYKKEKVINISPQKEILCITRHGTSGYGSSANILDAVSTSFLAADTDMPEPGKISLNTGGYYKGAKESEKIFENIWARLTRLADQGDYYHGIIYFNNPEHIDAFDTKDWKDGTWPTPWIGEEYASSSSELDLYYL